MINSCCLSGGFLTFRDVPRRSATFRDVPRRSATFRDVPLRRVPLSPVSPPVTPLVTHSLGSRPQLSDAVCGHAAQAPDPPGKRQAANLGTKCRSFCRCIGAIYFKFPRIGDIEANETSARMPPGADLLRWTSLPVSTTVVWQCRTRTRVTRVRCQSHEPGHEGTVYCCL